MPNIFPPVIDYWHPREQKSAHVVLATRDRGPTPHGGYWRRLTATPLEHEFHLSIALFHTVPSQWPPQGQSPRSYGMTLNLPQAVALRDALSEFIKENT